MALAAITPNPITPAAATPNAAANPAAPPATTPIALSTANNAGTIEAMIGTTKVKLEINAPCTILEITVPIVLIRVAKAFQEFMELSIPATIALNAPCALSESTSILVCIRLGIERNIAFSAKILETAAPSLTSTVAFAFCLAKLLSDFLASAIAARTFVASASK